jgi:hypothetical protein
MKISCVLLRVRVSDVLGEVRYELESDDGLLFVLLHNSMLSLLKEAP